MTAPVLAASDVTIGYRRPDGGEDVVVWRAGLQLESGHVLGLVGESGCGKSTLALALLGFRAGGARISEGSSQLGALDLLTLGRSQLERVWGRRIAYVAQNAATALNPTIPVGRQLAEPLALHLGLRGRALRERELELLEHVGIPDPARARARYPHQFSGGQQQRIAIAIALSCRPEVVILDEPTTGLDVTTQARISALLRTLLDETGAATLYVSHDLHLLATISDRIAVMYAGQIVEQGETAEVMATPRHPYTRALLAAVPSSNRRRGVVGIPGRPPSAVVLDACSFAPRCAAATEECRTTPPPLEEAGIGRAVRCLHWRTLEIRPRAETTFDLPAPQPELLLGLDSIVCHYPRAQRAAVDGVSLAVAAGEVVGIVGESGSGKSTLLRAIAGLHGPTSGTMTFRGEPLPAALGRRSLALLGSIQLVFQNPETALNPRQSIADIMRRPLRLFRDDVGRTDELGVIRELLDAVKLPGQVLHRLPGELSGGQKQRVVLARAFAARPALLLCDEVTSALDVSVQASILELLAELIARTHVAVVFVSHDLGVVRTIAGRALVMRDASVCEEGTVEQLFSAPSHAYTRELLGAVAGGREGGEAGPVASATGGDAR